MDGATLAVDAFFHLLVSQLATRLLTFFLNLLSTRSLTPEAYGVAAVQFHLINTTILFISREGFRRGCLRVGHHDPQATRRVLSVAALTIPLGAALSTLVTAVLLSRQRKADDAYSRALLMQGVAAFMEICSEPLYILASTRLLFRLRVSIETCATVAKGVLLLTLVQGTTTPPAIAFSWAQIAYAAVVLAGYLMYFIPQAFDGWRKQRQKRGAAVRGASDSCEGGEGWRWWALDSHLLRMSGTFTLQALEKLFLAEGSKMVMAVVQSSYAQGVYGLVTNLGSLVVRTLFQPFEEAAFTAFSKAAGEPAKPTPSQLSEQWRLLSLLVRAICIVGLLAAAFGPAYSYLALLTAYSRRWADTAAPVALGLYSQYIVLLAANGILESFVHSVATQRQLYRINVWLVAFAALHLGISLIAVYAWGANGLIVADGANMVARICYCLVFIARRFSTAVQELSLRQLLPSNWTLAVLAAAFCVTGTSRILLLYESAGIWVWWQKAFGKYTAGSLPADYARAILGGVGWKMRAGLHLMVGGICVAMVGGVLYVQERDVLRQLVWVRGGAAKPQDKQE